MKLRNSLFNVDLQLFGEDMFVGEGNPFNEPIEETENMQEDQSIDTSANSESNDIQQEQESSTEEYSDTTQHPEHTDTFDMRAYLDSFRQEVNEKIETIAPPQNEQEYNEPTEEEIEAEREEFWNKLTEEGPKFLEKQIEEKASQIAETKFREIRQQEIQAQQQQQHWENRFNQFVSEHEDAQEIIPQMIDLLENNPHLQAHSDPYDLAYKMIKFDQLQPQQPQNIEDMLQDEQVIEKVLQNDTVKQKFLESLKSNKAPVTISNAGTAPATPKQEMKSFREATRAFISSQM